MEKVKSADGTMIAYSKSGRGPALIIVDGAFCYSTYGPAPKLASLLSEHFTVYVYDRRGRGQSNDAGNYSIEKEIEDLKALVNMTGEAPCIFGNSSGAALVVESVVQGLNARKIALFEPPYSSEKLPPPEFRKTLSELVDQGERGKAVTFFFSKVMRLPFIIVFFLKIFARTVWKKNMTVAHTLVYDAELMRDFSVPEKARGISIPTAVIGGKKSPANMKHAVESLANTIPNSQVIWLKGQNHNVSMTALAPVLIEYFK